MKLTKVRIRHQCLDAPIAIQQKRLHGEGMRMES